MKAVQIAEMLNLIIFLAFTIDMLSPKLNHSKSNLIMIERLYSVTYLSQCGGLQIILNDAIN